MTKTVSALNAATKLELRDVCFAGVTSTLTANDTTPDVTDKGNFKTANTSSTTIYNFTGGVDGQRISVMINDSNTTLDFTGVTNLIGNGGADWTASVGDSFTAVRDASGDWWCQILESTAAGEENDLRNDGGGYELGKTKVGTDLPLRTLIDGSGITLSSDTNTITINADGAVGEANTASDGAGGDEGLTMTKSGDDLPFKSLIGGTDIDLTSDANTVTITNTSSSNLKTATGVVNVSSSAAPSLGQQLIATSSTTAEWQGISTFNVVDYGATGNGTTDDTTAIQDTVDAAGQNDSVFFPKGTYLITDTIDITSNGVHLQGVATEATRILFEPNANAECFKWVLTQDQGSIDRFTFHSTDTAYVKTAIFFEDGSDFHISNIHIGSGGGNDWKDISKSSIGITGYGREVVSINKIRIFADKPIVFGPNPNDVLLDCDQFHLSDTYLVNTPSTYNAKIEILDNTQLLNFTIDGYNAWALGRYGIYWNAPNNDSTCYQIRFSNIRHEQGDETGGAGWLIYIIHSEQHVQKLSLDNIHGDVFLSNGIYIEGADDLRMTNLDITGTGSGTPLQIVNNTAGDTKYVEWDNCTFGRFGGTSIIPDTLTLLEAIEPYDTTFSLPMSAKYRLRPTYTYSELGKVVASDLNKIYFARSLLSPQTGSSNVSFSGNTISSAGAVSFDGILTDESVYISGTSLNDGHYRAASDGTAGSLAVVESLTTESNTSGTVIHGMTLRYAGLLTYMHKTDITLYAENEATTDRILQCSTINGVASGTTGAVISETDNTIFASKVVSTSAKPTSDIFSYTLTTSPTRIWNCRGFAHAGDPAATGTKSTAHVIVEQLNF